MSDEIDEIVEASQRRRETLRELNEALKDQSEREELLWSWAKWSVGALIGLAPKYIPLLLRFIAENVGAAYADAAGELAEKVIGELPQER